MIVDNDGGKERGLKMLREDDIDDEGPLIFKDMKKPRTGTILETLEDLKDPGRGVNEDA